MHDGDGRKGRGGGVGWDGGGYLGEGWQREVKASIYICNNNFKKLPKL